MENIIRQFLNKYAKYSSYQPYEEWKEETWTLGKGIYLAHNHNLTVDFYASGPTTEHTWRLHVNDLNYACFIIQYGIQAKERRSTDAFTMRKEK